VAHCGCQEHVVEDVCRTAPAGHNFGVGSRYGAMTSNVARTSSAHAAHDNDDPNLGLDLDTIVDALSQVEDAPDLM
jgi:hypothetical protein